jgi:DNA-binding NarL/FixJ family response regulator
MQTLRLVLVDDNPVFLHALRDFLTQSENVDVAGCARSAQEGLEVIRRTKPDLVLMDINMPEMTGVEAVRRIARTGGLPKVMLMTGFGTDALLQHALEAGADGVVSKQDLHAEFGRLAASWFARTSPLSLLAVGERL